MKRILVGRKKELKQIQAVVEAKRHLLIEGPVGVGKTFLVQSVVESLGRDWVRIDGDTRYSEQKLTGWFDPPMVLKKGYDASCFIDGPLLDAFQNGKILFINELNRMPESVQNILLPAMDEGLIQIPRLGTKKAKSGFLVIATQNPKEFTATHVLSEALLDRFEKLTLSYQSRDEELEIAENLVGKKNDDLPLSRMLDLIRQTRMHEKIKRGASVRSLLALSELMRAGLKLEEAAVLALSGRIELVSASEDPAELILQLLSQPSFDSLPEKKKKILK